MVRRNRVLVAGATGGTGRCVAQLLAQHQIPARLVTSREAGRAVLASLGEVEVADLLQPEAAARAVRGVDAVVCAVGSRPNPIQMFFGKQLADDVGTLHLIQAAARAGVGHFVLVTSIGVAETSQDIPGALRAVLGKVLAAKQRAEEGLRRAELPYTILRPGGLSDGPATGEVLCASQGLGGMISRADVAYAAVAALFHEDARNRTLSLVGAASVRQQPPQREC